ncbi:nucleic-acid-binding protein from transposon X-element [Trichonephila clavata]|uniref:Nucleic-acid-binding protein from transposon X-element n=1 Tax=Trichonephila clavata TaxID=2740835 RepID=A0A8X6F7Y4_TRICU|nr:nucleic-acid-binding protein from transposon X-element [Trichonephila clavata]
MDEQQDDNGAYAELRANFHRGFNINTLADSLNECRFSDETALYLAKLEEVNAKLREFPYEKEDEQRFALQHISDLIDEARHKYTQLRKQEIADLTNTLEQQIDSWGLPRKPLENPFQIVLHKKKTRKELLDKEDPPQMYAKRQKKDDDITHCNNKFGALTVDDQQANMDVSGPSQQQTRPGPVGVETDSKRYAPPITIDNVKNQAALLKHLQDITKVQLQAQLIGTRMKIFPQTPYAYHIIRRYINDNNLEGHTFSLPEDKKLRAVIRGLPTDTDPSEIIAELKAHNICVEECHNMTNRKSGAPMPLFIIICTKSINNRGLFKIKELNNMKIVVEILRKKYGPPQCFRCQGFFHSSKYCTRAPRCVKCAGDHLTKACTKDIKDPAKCCLCEGDHPASYLQCPKNPNNMPKKEKKNNNIKQVDGTVFASPPPPASNAWDSRSTTPANNNNQKPTLIPRQIALAQAKAHNQAVQPVPISPPSQSPQLPTSPIPDIPNIFAQLRDPEVIDLFNSLQTFIHIAKTHKTRSARLSALYHYIYNDSVQ